MKTTEEGNKLIDAFMIVSLMEDKPLNYKHSSSFGKNYFKNLKYHSSWDWLMPVVEKIETIERGGYSLRFDIAGEVCTVNDINGDFIEVSGATKIDGAYRCVIEFIEWYNENK